MKHWLLAGVLLIAGCGSSEPIEIPDLEGLALPEARELADETGFDLEEVDASGEGRNVWSSSNWTVEGQDPDAGTTVDPGSEVTVLISNVSDTDEPEPVEEEPDEAEEEVDEPEDPPASSVGIDAEVGAGPSGLRFVPDQDLSDCRFDVNPGTIRSGYTGRVAEVPAGDGVTVPWGELTDRDGQRFNYGATRPEMVSVRCDDADGTTVHDVFGW